MVRELGRLHPGIRWIQRDRQPPGASTCRNIGTAEARGRFLVFLDSDDLLAPYCLEQRVAYLHAREHLDYAVFPMMVFRDVPLDQSVLWNVILPKEGDPAEALLRFVLRDPPWQTSMPIWRKEAVVRAGGWNESTSNWQDWDLHVRALAARLAYDVVVGAPDCFLRRGEQERISADDVSENAVRDKAIVFRQAIAAVRESDLWDLRIDRAFARLLLHYAERTALLARPWAVVEALLLTLREGLGRKEPRWLRWYFKVQHRLAMSRMPLLPGALYRAVRLDRDSSLASRRTALHQREVSPEAVRSLREAWKTGAPPIGIDWTRELTIGIVDAD